MESHGVVDVLSVICLVLLVSVLGAYRRVDFVVGRWVAGAPRLKIQPANLDEKIDRPQCTPFIGSLSCLGMPHQWVAAFSIEL